MAGEKDSGSKTEKATPKKLRDARKKGDVAKSRDLTSTLGLIFSFFVIWAALGFIAPSLAELVGDVFSVRTDDFRTALSLLGTKALKLLLISCALVVVPIMLFGMLVEFIQVGPILTAEKFSPKMSNLNPASGLKRMFGQDNLVELIKSIAKTALLVLICWMVVRALLPDLVLLPSAEPTNIVGAGWTLLLYLLGWTMAVFLLLTALDVSYQRFSFAKKMKMSIRDIRQEHKDTEGDPLIKGHRRDTAREWAQESAQRSAEDASVLVVNPTHIAVAIKYDQSVMPVPTVTAMGEDSLAVSMREAAEKRGVPIVRNRDVARKLLLDSEEGDIIPRELFDTIAEIILWAKGVRERVEHEKEHKFVKWDGKAIPAPGEDLTNYPTNL